MNDIVRNRLTMDRQLGTSRKDFNKMEQRIPCYQCIVLAACKGRTNIDCDILLRYYQEAIAFGSNTLIITKEMNDLFPHASSFNGTIIL